MFEYHPLPISPSPEISDVYLFGTVAEENITPCLGKYLGDECWRCEGEDITLEEMVCLNVWGDSVRWAKVNLPTK